jgi:hypothetical protein
VAVSHFLIGATIGLVQSAPTIAAPQEGAIIARAPSPVLTAGTPVRLMVTKEVNSRTAKPGERFKLRVDSPVSLNGKIVVPIGSVAWGELVAVSGTKAAGGKGRLEAKLLFIELGDRQIPITGSANHDGAENDAGVLLGVLSFGVLGLLNKGGNATLKAGDVFTAYLHQDEAFSQ